MIFPFLVSKKHFVKLLFVGGLFIFLPTFLTSPSIKEPIPFDQGLYIVESCKEIKIKEDRNAFNPSIISYKDGYLMIYRVDHRKNFFERFKSSVFKTVSFHLVELDEHFEQKTSSKELEMHSSTAEDPRLFFVKDQLWLTFNDWIDNCRVIYKTELRKCADRWTIGKRFPLVRISGHQKIEKNWIPLVIQEALHFIYKASPLEILKAMPSGDCLPLIKGEEYQWNYGEIRGGTPVVQIDDLYITFFHGFLPKPRHLIGRKQGGTYSIGAYALSSSFPYQMTSITPAPIIHPSYYDDRNHRRVLFPAGCIVKNGSIYLFHGTNDRRIEVSKLNKKVLLASMKVIDRQIDNESVIKYTHP